MITPHQLISKQDVFRDTHPLDKVFVRVNMIKKKRVGFNNFILAAIESISKDFGNTLILHITT